MRAVAGQEERGVTRILSAVYYLERGSCVKVADEYQQSARIELWKLEFLTTDFTDKHRIKSTSTLTQLPYIRFGSEISAVKV
jgi:hypothetical protein